MDVQKTGLNDFTVTITHPGADAVHAFAICTCLRKNEDDVELAAYTTAYGKTSLRIRTKRPGVNVAQLLKHACLAQADTVSTLRSKLFP